MKYVILFFYNFQKVNVYWTIYLYSIHAGINRLRNAKVKQICYQDLTPTHYFRRMTILTTI